MDIPALFERMPFSNHLGIELLSAGDGHAVGQLEIGDEHSSSPETMVTHGGVTHALAGTVGGAAALSANDAVTPTVDVRIDYLAPATGGTLRAEADLVRNGDSVATDDEGDGNRHRPRNLRDGRQRGGPGVARSGGAGVASRRCVRTRPALHRAPARRRPASVRSRRRWPRYRT